MRRSIWEKIREILKKHVLHGKWVRSVIALACIVTFITTYLLIMPAVTRSRAADCGQEEHTHTEDCYDEEGNLICGMEEHAHDDSCYTSREVLVCGREEHVHTEDCWAETEPIQEDIPEEDYEEEPEEAADEIEEEHPQTGGTVTEQAAAAVPEQLSQIRFKEYLTDWTTIYYVPEDGDNWQPLAEDKWHSLYGDNWGIRRSGTEDRGLDPEEEILLHIGYRIPAGRINATNPQAEFILPLSINMTEEEVRDNNNDNYTLFSGTDREENELFVDGEYEIVEEWNSDGEVTLRKLVITFNEDACLRCGGEKLTDGSETLAPEELEGFFELRVRAEDLLTLEKKSETAYVLKWNEEEDLDTTVHFNPEKLAAYFDAKNGDSAETEAEEPAQGELRAEGEDYTIIVSYTEEAGLPAGVSLKVEEITEDQEDESYKARMGEEGDDASAYELYLERTRETLGLGADPLTYVRFFDIKIMDGNGQEVEITAPVDVKIELADKGEDEQAQETTKVIHFADDAETGDVLESVEVDGGTVCFEADGFSAYAIVEGPSAINMDTETVASLDELADYTGEAFYLSYGSPAIYFKNTLNNKKAFNETEAGKYEDAAEWFFEKVSEDDNAHYRIYTYVNNVKKYVYNPSDNNAGLTDVNGAAVFELSPTNDGKAFYIKLDGADKWLQHSGSGSGIRFWTDNNNATNSRITLAYPDSFQIADDPYGLDGKSYGLMNWNGGVAGKALMASQNGNALEAKSLTVMSSTDNSSQLFVPNDSEISMWTFQWDNADNYYLTATVDGSTKYLKIDSNGLSLADSQEEASLIQVVAGTGIHAGEICLKSGGTTLTYSGTVDGGFSVGGSVGNEWLHFVESSDLTSDYFRTYSAQKVSVSDNVKVANSSRIIVYTRYWNEEKKRYDFFAIDHDGTLVPVYENGDSIEWTAGQLNTMLWNFTEYYWEGTNDPNHYYELYNQYSGKYIAPQVTGNQILSDDPIGINLNGRRDGKYYTPILAWDEEDYSYVGLKVENGRIVPGPMSETMDFYFAVMQDLNVDDNLTTVPTVDHTQYGITMKMIDLNNAQNMTGDMNKFLGSNTGGAVTTLDQGLLSTNLGADGYPTAAGGSLKDLYNSNDTAQEVNHLFIESTYYSSGYFMYDSTQNFASLNNGNNFTVYKELGSYDSGGNKPTLKHGQFFPYNDLKPGVFTSVNKQNTYGLNASTGELPDSDPRKYEQLYSIEHDGKKADTYFAMELEASFNQTPSGLDAWGHDIIFEFTGDDDFWLYVDGELVIDLGGIHSAVPGSVNFRTGEVNVNGTHTTLRALFEENYRKRNPDDVTDEAVNAYLAEHFKDGGTVFEDDTLHTMRIFYMERGAGASNLQMRFNLAAVKKGTVQLNKQLSGVDDPASVKVEFPYQIWYKDENGVEKRLQNAVPDDPIQNDDYVHYKDSVNPVKYVKELVVNGATNEDGEYVSGIKYEDVFFLKQGETADISFPKAVTEHYPDGVPYRIVECGINTDVYSKVTVNGSVISGTTGTGSLVENAGSGTDTGYEGYENRKDFGINYATTDERSKVNYVNEVDQNALRTMTITKKLYKEDGKTELAYTDDKTLFTLRLYLASEYEGLDVADMHSYHVKNPEGYYCRWDRENQIFVQIENEDGQGITDYAQLSEEQKNDSSINFTTSIYGTIAKIPAGYTVEIRNVLPGTQYRVEERPEEIPDGYSFQTYEWNNTEEGNAKLVTRSNRAGVNGTVVSKEDDPVDPYVNVCNLKGWGLRVNKLWSDAEYMTNRDATYFAVYTGTSEKNLTLVPGTVRKMEYGAKPQTLYWYFLPLPVEVPFDQYEIREVTITNMNPTINEEGVVEDPGTVTPIVPEGTLTINGKQKGETTSSDFDYTVLYNKGTVEEGSNVREDAVTNNRPGIVLKKAEWDGSTPLQGAAFTLIDEEGDLIGTFTSNEAGSITEAFLRDDVNYTLTETSAPQGWYGLQAPLTLKLHDGTVTVSGVDEDYYLLDREEGKTPTLTVKDRPYTFEAVKKDYDTKEPMAGVVFSLHKEKTVDGVTSIDLNPEVGYESLVTNNNGEIPGIDNTLPAGTYELWESTPDGYQPISNNGRIRFRISQTGGFTLVGTQGQPVPDGVSISGPVEQDDGSVAYTMTILNRRQTNIKLKKVDNNNRDLKGSKFKLCKYTDTWEAVSGYADIDLTSKASITIEKLTSGVYRLEETRIPDGYIITTKHHYFKINEDMTVTLCDENGDTVSGNTWGSATLSNNTAGYTISVKNTPGAALPNAGGPGTGLIYLLGTMLTIFAGAGLLMRKRRFGDL